MYACVALFEPKLGIETKVMLLNWKWFDNYRNIVSEMWKQNIFCFHFQLLFKCHASEFAFASSLLRFFASISV